MAQHEIEVYYVHNELLDNTDVSHGLFEISDSLSINTRRYFHHNHTTMIMDQERAQHLPHDLEIIEPRQCTHIRKNV